MKRILLLSFLSFFIVQLAFAQKVTFTYDASGNQIQRKLICVNCTPPALASTKQSLALQKNAIAKEPVEIKENNRTIKAYPNPVKETLNVNWKIDDPNVFISQIDVYGVNSVKVFSKKYSTGDRETQIPFINLPPGMYIVYVIYSDTKRESIKIIKI